MSMVLAMEGSQVASKLRSETERMEPVKSTSFTTDNSAPEKKMFFSCLSYWFHLVFYIHIIPNIYSICLNSHLHRYYIAMKKSSILFYFSFTRITLQNKRHLVALQAKEYFAWSISHYEGSSRMPPAEEVFVWKRSKCNRIISMKNMPLIPADIKKTLKILH